MLTYKRPAGSATEELFIRTYIDKLFGIRRDSYGNRILKIGNNDVGFACHTDTVHHTDGFQEVFIDTEGTARTQQRTSGGVESGSVSAFTKQPLAQSQQVLPVVTRPGKEPLGADDSTGVWLMLNLAEAGVPGLYIFHRNEEHGGLGSEHIKKNKKTLKGIKKMIAFDRRGFNSIITHQRGSRCCSDEFARELARQLGWYKIDNTGIFTDSANYVNIVPECTNVSVGYEHEHSPNETQDLVYAESLYQKLRRVNWSSLPVVRKIEKEKPQHEIVYREWDNNTQAFGYESGYEGWRDLDEEEYQRKVVIDTSKENKETKKKGKKKHWDHWNWKDEPQEAEKFGNKNDWVCSKCGRFMNYTYNNCTWCGTPRNNTTTRKALINVEGAWECKWCHTTNYSDNKLCWKCQHKKGTQPKRNEQGNIPGGIPEGLWRCESCGILNSNSLFPKMCAQCKAPRTKSSAVPQTISPYQQQPRQITNLYGGDWTCPSCGTTNSSFSSPMFCKECGTSKNQTAIRLHDTKISKKEKKKQKKQGFWLCKCGTRNDLDESYCEECGRNRYSGFSSGTPTTKPYDLGKDKWFMGGL